MTTTKRKLESIRNWQTRHWDKVRRYKCKWREANREKNRLCNRAYYRKNRTKILKWNAAHKRQLRTFLKTSIFKPIARGPEIQKIKNQRRYQDNKVRYRDIQQRFRIANRDHVRKQSRRYYQKHRIKRLLQAKIYREKNATLRSRLIRRWRDANKSHIRDYNRNRYKNNPIFAIRRRLSSRINKLLKRSHAYKSNTTLALVGLSLDQLKMHLERQFLPGMTWKNRSEWHVDHIRPCASFDLTDHAQQSLCFHYTNLQPLWSTDNMHKAAKL